jgi:uncharacterized membrane protein
VVTGAVNVPLNNALASGDGDPAAVRAGFEARWVRWNTVSAVAGVLALICLCCAPALGGRTTGGLLG